MFLHRIANIKPLANVPSLQLAALILRHCTISYVCFPPPIGIFKRLIRGALLEAVPATGWPQWGFTRERERAF